MKSVNKWFFFSKRNLAENTCRMWKLLKEIFYAVSLDIFLHSLISSLLFRITECLKLWNNPPPPPVTKRNANTRQSVAQRAWPGRGYSSNFCTPKRTHLADTEPRKTSAAQKVTNKHSFLSTLKNPGETEIVNASTFLSLICKWNLRYRMVTLMRLCKTWRLLFYNTNPRLKFFWDLDIYWD